MSSSGSVPDPSDILSLPEVRDGSAEGVARQGIRGVIYTIGLFAVALVSGFIDIISQTMRAIADGAAATTTAYLDGIALIIGEGAAETAENFLLGGPFAFIEAMFWTFAVLWAVNYMMQYFGTDIPVLPGFDIIPFYGNEIDDDGAGED